MKTCARLLLPASLLLMLTGCGDTPPERMKAGDELYNYYCRHCHEKQGLGPYLEQFPAGPDAPKAYEIVLMIKHGYDLGHKGMPSFPQLSDQQADAVATFIHSRRPRTAHTN